METIEKRTADTILQRDETIIIGGREWVACQPTPATLIMISEQIAELPQKDGENSLIIEVLKTARDCKAVGKIAATLILGAKRIRENRQIQVGARKPKWYSWKREEPIMASELDYLADTIMSELTTEQVKNLLLERLNKMQVADFFAVTTFLRGATITKPTREPEATASGQ